MMLVPIVFIAGVLLELCMYAVPAGWRARRVLAPICLMLTAFASGAIVMWRPNGFTAAIAIISLYRVFNYLRIAEGRMHEQYLRYAIRRTGLLLCALQALAALYWAAWHAWEPNSQTVWVAVTGVQLAAAITLFVSLLRSLRHTRWPLVTKHVPDSDLPTLTIAIPARNETADLQACIESIIPSDYPKLEILVLDDCSQTKRTPEIIRSYAHDGVRFIQGEAPRETWLAKNQAYDRLAGEASGQYIVFCGVDVRFGPSSLRQLVELLLSKNKQMISILPWRSDGVQHHSAITQAMRYFWELVPPRRLFNRPPVLSSCWIIRKQALIKAGGFAAVARAIVPEAHFARSLVATDGYSFMRSSKNAGIESVKSPADQRGTALRTRYPQLHKRPENVLLLTAASVALVLMPFVLAPLGFWVHISTLAQVLATTSSVLLVLTYIVLTRATRTRAWWWGWLGMPLGALYDIGLLHYSMWQYEFSTVEWKGRNICIPAMHVIPRLPKME